MARYVTISVRIPVEMRERMRSLGIRPSEALREALKIVLARAEVERLRSRWARVRPVLEKVPVEHVAMSIREDRDSR